MKYKVGDRVKVVDPYSGGNFKNGDIVVICEVTTRSYGAMSPYDRMMWFLYEDEVESFGCSCCNGDEPLMWEDDYNNAFVDSAGEIMVTANGNITRFKVKYCPNCGKIFD